MQDTVALAILAGGGGRRLGGADKALLTAAGRPLLAHVLDRVRPQAGHIVLSANGNATRFATFGLPVVADRVPDAGPIAGIAAAAAYCASAWPETQWLVTLPVDTPCPPPDLVPRLAAATRASGQTAVAKVAERRHWAVACWPLAEALALDTALRDAGVRRLESAVRAQGMVDVAFADADAFRNVNTAADLAALERALTPP